MEVLPTVSIATAPVVTVATFILSAVPAPTIASHAADNVTRDHVSWNYVCNDCYNAYTLAWENSIMYNNHKLLSNIQRLRGFGNFQDNWNGYGAAPFSKELLDISEHILMNLDHQPEVFPIAGGAIQFEYDRDDGAYLEFEIMDDLKAHCYAEFPNGIEEESDMEVGRINEVVNEFYGEAIL